MMAARTARHAVGGGGFHAVLALKVLVQEVLEGRRRPVGLGAGGISAMLLRLVTPPELADLF